MYDFAFEYLSEAEAMNLFDYLVSIGYTEDEAYLEVCRYNDSIAKTF